MAAAICEIIHTFPWKAPTCPVTILQVAPSVCFSSESLCPLMIAQVQSFEGRGGKQKVS